MSDGIYSALSGAVAQQQAMDVVANNVANVGTVGYRGDQLAFREALSRGESGPNPDGLRYVSVAQLSTDSTDGPLNQTGNPLDVALSGDGMFAVRTEDGVRYTRAGSFRMDAQGIVRTPSGHAVLPEGDDPDATIQIPVEADAITIGTDGTITVDDQPVGRIRVVRFDEGQLEKQGATLYVPVNNARGEPATNAQVSQGYLEGANVNPVGGMNELIQTSRAFEAFQRVIQAFRQIDERAARDIGGR
ncbi:MAG: flagellar basal-body rod protein FlgF [Sandaracinaceae bacterium]